MIVEGLVSVVIPVHNRPGLVVEALESVLAQTYRSFEILLVDDGSTDETPRVCEELARARAGIVRALHRENGGPGQARETGRLAARGEFLQYLDSDDLLHPKKLERQVEALRAHLEASIAYCKTREYRLGEAPGTVASFRTGERLETLFPALLSGRCWMTLTPLFRRSVTDAVGSWSTLRQEEDWEYDARAAALGARLVWCPEFLADVRHHEEPRAGGRSLKDPARMADRATAHRLIYKHARRAGVPTEDPCMQRFARELFLIARQAGAMGLEDASRDLLALAREASGCGWGARWDLDVYEAAARVIGWRAAGWLGCFSDRFRRAA